MKKSLLTLLIAGSCALSAQAAESNSTQTQQAQTMITNNMTADINDGIISKSVTFDSNGNQLVGNLILPADYDGKSKLPAVIVTGAWTTVKEQMPSTYAKELAKKGFATLVFDFGGWGDSAGKNRYVEDPIAKTNDIKAAAQFLKTRNEIDADKVGGLGVCASSGYMVKAYSEGALKSAALVAPWLHDQKIATAVYGGEDSVKKLLALSDDAEKSFKATGEIQVIPAQSTTNKDVLMYNVPYYTETNRGLIEEFDNKFNLASWRPWLTFDAIQYADKIPGKILFVESEAMALPQGSKAFKAVAGDKVQSVNLPDVTQFDFYDQAEPVEKSVKSVAEFMGKNL